MFDGGCPNSLHVWEMWGHLLCSAVHAINMVFYWVLMMALYHHGAVENHIYCSAGKACDTGNTGTAHLGDALCGQRVEAQQRGAY